MAKQYTKEEEELILDYIRKNPKNISQACREAAYELGRTPSAISARYYKILKDNHLVYAMVTPKVVVTSNSNKSKITKTLWKGLESFATRVFFKNK